MKVHQVDPEVDCSALLAGARFIDAYSIAIDDATGSWSAPCCGKLRSESTSAATAP